MSKKILISFFIISFFILVIPARVSADSISFEVQEYTDVELHAYIDLSRTEHRSAAIEKFAISSQNMIAVGFSDKYINIYDSSLNFQYSFCLTQWHYTYYLQWEGDILHVLVSCTEWQYDIQLRNGEVKIYAILDTEDNQKNWKNYHIDNSYYGIYRTKEYTYYRTLTKCCRKNKTTNQDEEIVNVSLHIFKVFIFIVVWLLITILIFINIYKEKCSKANKSEENYN